MGATATSLSSSWSRRFSTGTVGLNLFPQSDFLLAFGDHYATSHLLLLLTAVSGSNAAPGLTEGRTRKLNFIWRGALNSNWIARYCFSCATAVPLEGWAGVAGEPGSSGNSPTLPNRKAPTSAVKRESHNRGSRDNYLGLCVFFFVARY